MSFLLSLLGGALVVLLWVLLLALGRLAQLREGARRALADLTSKLDARRTKAAGVLESAKELLDPESVLVKEIRWFEEEIAGAPAPARLPIEAAFGDALRRLRAEMETKGREAGDSRARGIASDLKGFEGRVDELAERYNDRAGAFNDSLAGSFSSRLAARLQGAEELPLFRNPRRPGMGDAPRLKI